MMLCCAIRADAPTRYTIGRGDSLKGVARKFNVSVSELAGANGLSTKSGLRVGQELVIPAKAKAPASGGLSASASRTIRAAKVQPGRWQHIVIHHSGTDFATVAGMDRYHRVERRMENGLAYHFVIGNGRGMKDGEVVIGKRWTGQLDGGHLAIEDLNRNSLGICLIGNFDKNRPTEKQMSSLRSLITALNERCGLSAEATTTHSRIHPQHTQCPGKNFPAKQLRTELTRR
jgi:LysM repeat protein